MDTKSSQHRSVAVFIRPGRLTVHLRVGHRMSELTLDQARQLCRLLVRACLLIPDLPGTMQQLARDTGYVVDTAPQAQSSSWVSSGHDSITVAVDPAGAMVFLYFADGEQIELDVWDAMMMLLAIEKARQVIMETLEPDTPRTQ